MARKNEHTVGDFGTSAEAFLFGDVADLRFLNTDAKKPSSEEYNEVTAVAREPGCRDGGGPDRIKMSSYPKGGYLWTYSERVSETLHAHYRHPQ